MYVRNLKMKPFWLGYDFIQAIENQKSPTGTKFDFNLP